MVKITFSSIIGAAAVFCISYFYFKHGVGAAVAESIALGIAGFVGACIGLERKRS